MEKVWNNKINANWGGRKYSEQDIMHAVAPIANNISILGWKAKISLEEGVAILKNDIEKQ